MMRKGQYLALETVLSLGISIIVATSTVVLFDDYRGTVMEDINDRHSMEIESKIITSLNNLKHLDSGSSISLDLPDLPASDPYRVSLEDNRLVIESNRNSYTQEIASRDWIDSMRGSVTSTDVQILKIEDEIVLRPE